MKLSNAALILVGHGSRLAGFEKDMQQIAAALKSKMNFKEVSCAYLEINKPSIPAAIDRVILAGAQKVFVLPYFLLKGRHTQKDIPEIVRASRTRHKGAARILLCDYLGFDTKLVELAKKKVLESLS